MKLAVIYHEKKFIVVVPKDSSVADLKTEIEKVYCALFESSGLTEAVTEVQTLTGCVLYGGYKVSSVLSDNDTVIALGATPRNSYTPSQQVNAFSSPTHISYRGYNPLDYYSPVLGGHVLSHGVGGSPYTPPQSHIIPPMLGALRLGLFQSPSAKTVASQCPSPQYITRDTPASQPHQSSSEREGDFSQQEKKSEEERTATAEESESPLGDLSHLPAKATPQQKILFSRHTTTAGESTDSAAAGASGVRKRKRTPQKRAQSAKKQPAEVVQQKKKSELEDGKGKKVEGKAGEGDKSVAIEKLQKGGVSGGSRNTALPKKITQQPSTSNLPSQLDSPKSSSEPSASCLPKTKVHTPDHKHLQDGPLSPQSPEMKKRKLSRNAASGGNKITTKKRSKKVVLEDSKETCSPNDDSSGWTSTDESEGEVDKKNSPPSTGKQLKAAGVESVSKPKTLEEKSASKNSSSSEWESEGDDMDSTASTAATTTSVASATQKSLDQSQTNKNTKATKPQKNLEPGLKPLGNKREAPTKITDQSITNENKKAPKPRKKPQPSPNPKSGNKRSTPTEMTDSSSDWDWSTDDEGGETDSKSQDDKTSQPTKKQDLKVKKGSRNKSGEKGKTEKAVKGSTESVGGAKESKKKEKSSSESEQGKLLKSWSETSTPSPTKRYTACDGQRLRQKRLEDLKNCSKVSEMAKTDKTESALGATGETTLAPENDTEDGEDRGTAEDTHGLGDKEEVDMEVAANDSSKDTEILAPNSVPSDEEVVGTLSKSHVSAGDASLATDEVTVIQDSQEMEDTCDYSRPPSPEIPLLRHSSNQPLFTPQQKMQENVTLKTLANSPSTYDKKKKDTSAGGDGVQKKKNKLPRDHSGSETDLVQSHTSTQKQKNKKLKEGNDGASDNAVEISDGTFSGVSGSLRQLPKISHSSQKGSKGTMTEAEAPPSQGESELGAEGEQISERKTKRKKRKREVSSLTVVPSSQTDQSEGEGALVIDCDDQVEDKDLDSSQSESQGSVSLTSSVEQNSSQLAEVENESNATASDQQQSGEEKKKRKKKRKKRRSIAAENAGGDDVRGTNTDAPVKNAGFPADDSEDLEEGMTTDVTSDCSLRQSQSVKKKKKKRKKKEVTLPQSEVITKKTTGNPPHSEESEQKGICNDDSGTELDDGGQNDISSDREKEKRASGLSPHKSTGPNGGKDGFLKPVVPPSKKSPNSSKVQLSPAAKISLYNRVSPSKLKSEQPKESSLLSVFSVTETEMSSEESSSERVKPTSRANKEKNAKKLNFLSSLGSHGEGKKISPARPSVPFSRSSLLTPFSSSRLSSETGVRMFSLSHSPRSSARKVKPRISPSKTPSARRKHLDSLSPSLDQLLSESQSGQKAGGESSGKVSVSDLLADGSLWDT